MKKTTIGLTAGILIVVLAVTAMSLPTMQAGGYRSAVFSKSYGYGYWIELDENWKTIMTLNITLPVNAYVLVDCDGYIYSNKAEVEIAIGIDSPTEDPATRRFYGVYDTDNYEFDKVYTGIHTSKVYYLDSGTHTIYFLAKVHKHETSYEASANYMTITAVVFTDGSALQIHTTQHGGSLTGE